MQTGDQNEARRPVALLVDDDADLLQLTPIFLEREGFRVVTAQDGLRALKLLEVVEPDVIITDLMMPVLDGLAFIEAYRHGPPPHVPVIAASGIAPYLDEARALGATATVHKPYDGIALASLARRLATGGRVEATGPSAVPPEDEHARLQAALDAGLEEPEPGMQRFLDEVAAAFDVPIAGISAVTADWQRLVTHCSTLDSDPGGPRKDSFCTHAVSARSALVIQNAADNPFFRRNPSVTERGFQFYAGVPLMAAHGEAIGTLCILDFEPHRFTYYDLELLGLFARRVIAAFERRDKRRHPSAPNTMYKNLLDIDEELDVYGRALFADLVVVETSRALQKGVPIALVAVDLPRERLEAAASALREVADGGLVGRLHETRLAAVISGRTAEHARSIVERVVGDEARFGSLDLHHYQGTTGLALLQVEQQLEPSSWPDESVAHP